ncbi:MAG: alpha/beta fold hydrolase [Chloroflexi bacterium]|nr:alpha/beta fold hydrolase [Chloroflexota bacterium]
MRRLKLAILVVLALFVVYGGGSWYIASQATRAERELPGQTPGSVGLRYQGVDFASRDDGVTLNGWYINSEHPKGAVIIVHGLDANKADKGTGILQLARRLHDQGMAVFLFDLRGHGESGEGKLSGGQFEQRDLLGAFDWLVGNGVAPDKIGLLGLSLGGAIALMSAAQEPRLQAVVADSAFADLSDLTATEVAKRLAIPYWLSRSLNPGVTLAAQAVYGIDLRSVSPEEAIARLPYPVLLIHSRTDGRISYDNAVRLKSASRNPDTVLWTVDKAEHAKSFVSYPDEYVQRVTGYFENRWK